MSAQTPAATELSHSPVSSMTVPPWRWGVSLLLAAAASWVWLNYTPLEFNLPKELLGVDMYSPPEVQQAAAEQSAVLYWQNSLIRLGGVGFCFGAVAFLTFLGAGKRRRGGPVVLGLVSGVLCGALAVVVGTYLRRYLNSGVALPLVGEANRRLVGDTCVYMLTSVVLALPVCLVVLVGGGKHLAQKAMSIILAGGVAGLLTPMAVSLTVHTSQTNEFPPVGLALTAIWMIALASMIFVFSTFTGTRVPKGKSSIPEDEA